MFAAAETTVLEFKETGMFLNGNKRIIVKATSVPETFKVIKGITNNNQITSTSKVTLQDVKQLWIDSIVNGYECVTNLLFPRGILDCVPPELVKPICEAPYVDQSQFHGSAMGELQITNVDVAETSEPVED